MIDWCTPAGSWRPLWEILDPPLQTNHFRCHTERKMVMCRKDFQSFYELSNFVTKLFCVYERQVMYFFSTLSVCTFCSEWYTYSPGCDV